MHYGVIGMGPVGTVLATMLAASGKKVSVLDVNPYIVELLRKKPLKISGHYEAQAKFKQVFDKFEDFAASAPDVILISVKTYQLQGILYNIRSCAELAGIPVVSCQNGLDTELEVAEALGEERAFRMILNFGVGYGVGNEEVKINFINEPHFLSSVSPQSAQLAKTFVQHMNEAGIGVNYIENIRTESFKKAILNSTLSSICALTRMTMSEAMKNPELLRIVRELIRENIWICKGFDIELEEDFLEQAVAYLMDGGNHKPSMLIDIERGRRTEIDHLAGKLYHYADKKDLPVPVTQTMYYLVKSLEKSIMLHK
jgi:2-dehydropantoate 2-reductase